MLTFIIRVMGIVGACGGMLAMSACGSGRFGSNSNDASGRAGPGGFGEDVEQLSDLGFFSLNQITTDGAGTWMASFDLHPNGGGEYSMLTRSTDNGHTWSRPIPLANSANDSPHDTFAQVAGDGAGNWIAVWLSYREDLGGRVRVARSEDDGVTWTETASLDPTASTEKGSNHVPHCATDGRGTWIVAWSSRDDIDGTVEKDTDIFVARSTDRGRTWSAPAVLNTDGPTRTDVLSTVGPDDRLGTVTVETYLSDDYYPHVSTNGDGSWIVVWTAAGTFEFGSDDDIFFSRSADDGTTWSDAAPLNTDADGRGRDFRPRVAAGGNGTWVAVWQRPPHIRFARSTDDGITWADPEAIVTSIQSDSGIGIPDIAADGAGNWGVVWSVGTYSDSESLMSRSTNDGMTWMEPLILEAAQNNAAMQVWNGFPHVASDGRGNWVAVWERTSRLEVGRQFDTDMEIIASHSTDDGATWSAPVTAAR